MIVFIQVVPSPEITSLSLQFHWEIAKLQTEEDRKQKIGKLILSFGHLFYLVKVKHCRKVYCMWDNSNFDDMRRDLSLHGKL